jgi:hypothetical protein
MSATKMSHGKLHLGLRKTKLEREIEQQKYPHDLSDALRRFQTTATNILAEQYEQVLLFIHLQQFGSFWLDDGCKTLTEWLARRDLPQGATLANREIIVRLFDKETFMTAGDDMLGEMAFLVSKFQPDTEQRKKDYKAIFEAYCKQSDVFDKQEFRKIVNWYINVNYVKPSGTPVKDNTARPPRTEPKGTVTTKEAQPNTDRATVDDMPKDFGLRQTTCAGCREKQADIESFVEHVAYLRQVIETNNGKDKVPTLPSNLKHYFDV